MFRKAVVAGTEAAAAGAVIGGDRLSETAEVEVEMAAMVLQFASGVAACAAAAAIVAAVVG